MTQSLRDAEKALVGLAREMAKGHLEVQEKSDGFRDDLDKSLLLLSKREWEMICLLSGDLYLFSDDKYPHELVTESIASIKDRMRETFNAGQFSETLAIVRKIPLHMLDGDLFWVIGTCWEVLGFKLAANEFYDYAYLNHGLSSKMAESLL